MSDRVMVIGDMHLSDSFKGSHKNYRESCIRLMALTLENVKKESPSKIVFLGDFIGSAEKNIRTRTFFVEVIHFLQELNDITNNNVYMVLGNHDIGGSNITDVNMLIELGLLKHVSYFDMVDKDVKGNDKLLARFHIIDYGAQRNVTLSMAEGDVSNVVLGHDDYAFTYNEATHYGTDVILSNMVEWEGVELVLSGHIHKPSTEIRKGRIGDKPCSIFFLGAPSRPSDRYEDCWYVVFESAGDSVGYRAENFGLWSVEEEFIEEEENLDGYDEESAELHHKEFRKLLKELTESRLLKGSLKHQIEVFPGATEEVRKEALGYLNKSIDVLSR